MSRLLRFVFAASLLSAAVPAIYAQDLIVDTFNDDTLGMAPGTPEVGTSSYFGVATQVVSDDMSLGLNLQSSDASTADGFAVQWRPSGTAGEVDVSYELRVVSDTSPQPTQLFSQTVAMSNGARGIAGSVSARWNSNGSIEVNGTQLAQAWTPGSIYLIRIAVSCAAGNYNVWVNGVPQVVGGALGATCSELFDFSHSSTLSGVTVVSFDQLRVTTADSVFSDGFESGDTAAWSGPPSVAGETCTNPVNYSGGILTGSLLDNTASGVMDTCSTGNTVDEWISYTATCDGFVEVSTCHSGTDFDTVLSAWPQASCTTAMQLDCNDDAIGAPAPCDLNGDNRKSLSSFASVSGQTYLFRVSGFNNSAGTYEVNAQCTFTP